MARMFQDYSWSEDSPVTSRVDATNQAPPASTGEHGTGNDSSFLSDSINDSTMHTVESGGDLSIASVDADIRLAHQNRLDYSLQYIAKTWPEKMVELAADRIRFTQQTGAELDFMAIAYFVSHDLARSIYDDIVQKLVAEAINDASQVRGLRRVPTYEDIQPSVQRQAWSVLGPAFQLGIDLASSPAWVQEHIAILADPPINQMVRTCRSTDDQLQLSVRHSNKDLATIAATPRPSPKVQAAPGPVTPLSKKSSNWRSGFRQATPLPHTAAGAARSGASSASVSSSGPSSNKRSFSDYQNDQSHLSDARSGDDQDLSNRSDYREANDSPTRPHAVKFGFLEPFPTRQHPPQHRIATPAKQSLKKARHQPLARLSTSPRGNTSFRVPSMSPSESSSQGRDAALHAPHTTARPSPVLARHPPPAAAQSQWRAPMPGSLPDDPSTMEESFVSDPMEIDWVPEPTVLREAAREETEQPRQMAGFCTTIYSAGARLFGWLAQYFGRGAPTRIVPIETDNSGRKRRAVDASLVSPSRGEPESEGQATFAPMPRHPASSQPAAPSAPALGEAGRKDVRSTGPRASTLGLGRGVGVRRPLSLPSVALPQPKRATLLPPRPRETERDARVASLLERRARVVLRTEQARVSPLRREERLVSPLGVRTHKDERGARSIERTAEARARIDARHAEMEEQGRLAREAEEAERQKAEDLRRRAAEVAERQKAEAEMLTGQLIRPLEEEWDRRVKDAVVGNSNRTVAKSVEGVDLSKADFVSLLPLANQHKSSAWLNDNIVNTWFASIIAEKREQTGWKKGEVPAFEYYNSGWYTNYRNKSGVSGIKSWSRRKGIAGKNLLKAEKIFFPTNTGNHWLLVTISPQEKTIQVLDSLRSPGGPRYYQIAREWLEMELGKDYVAEDWRDDTTGSSRQDNSDDCGAFTCLNGLAAAKGKPFTDVTAEKMQDARRMIGAVLINQGFSGDWRL